MAQTEPLAQTPTNTPTSFESVTSIQQALNSADANFTPADLALRSINYKVKEKQGEKSILRDVSVDFNRKEMTALMGPSGSGKTTIMNILTSNSCGKIEGDRYIAFGESEYCKLTPRLTWSLKQIIKLVTQDDCLMTALTVRETLDYAAELRSKRNVTREQRKESVSKIIKCLNLESAEPSKIGSIQEKGISGGERKRVCVGQELLACPRPAVLLLDEPTSGLDSNAAYKLITTLKDLAKQGQTIVCTIHQPSYQLFLEFNKLLMLGSGEVLYFGLPGNLKDYFKNSLGHELHPKENPVDMVLKIIQNEVVEKYQPKDDGLRGIPAVVGENDDIRASSYTTSQFTQVCILFRRNVYDCFLDKNKILSIFCMKIIYSSLVGICFWSLAYPRETSTCTSVTSALFLFVMNCTVDNCGDVLVRFPAAKGLLMNEYKNGLYSSSAWFVAHILYLYLIQLVQSLLLITPAYLMIRLRLEPEVILISALVMMIASCLGSTLGLLAGAFGKDIQQAATVAMPLTGPLVLFCGYIITYEKIPIVFRWVYHVDMIHWALSILQVTQFRGLEFDDCPPLGTSGAFCHCASPQSKCLGDEYLKQIGLDSVSRFDYFMYLLANLFVLLVPTHMIVHWRVNQKTG